MRALCLIALLFAAHDSNADSYRVVQTLFLPPVFYVGDTVEARIRIDTDGSALPSEPKAIPESEWIELHGIRVIPIAGQYDIRIQFTSFKPGVTEIPAIDFGEIELRPLSIETASIRDSRNYEFHDVFEPIYLPGTKLLIGIAAGTVLFGPLLILLLIGWLRRIFGRFARSFVSRRPYRTLQRSLSALHGSATRIDAREFFVSLMAAFRSYLSGKSSFNYRAATTKEMHRMLINEFAEVDSLSPLGTIIDDIDRAKFAGVEYSAAQKLRGLTLVKSAADGIERSTRRAK